MVSTPEHVHFAGYLVGQHSSAVHDLPDVAARSRASRVGTSRTYTNGQAKAVLGVALRCSQERADACWVISTHADRGGGSICGGTAVAPLWLADAAIQSRQDEAAIARLAPWSLIKHLLDRLFAEHDTRAGAERLLADSGLSFERPHVQPGTYTKTEVRRRRLAISLCGDRRGRSPMHRIALFGYDRQGRRCAPTAWTERASGAARIGRLALRDGVQGHVGNPL